MNDEKLQFLKIDFVPMLQHLNADAKGRWGVMNGQQMVEHFADAVKNASGKLLLPKLNEGEKLEKFRQFLMSDHPFMENTSNPLMNEKGEPLRRPDMQAAIKKLREELDYFFEIFESNLALTTHNAFFGELDYTMNVQLLHKHAQHHLRQFGLIE